MNLSPEELESFYDQVERKYREFKNSGENTILMHYIGSLNKGFANALLSRLEILISERVNDKQANKRFFNSYIEAIQNIRLHSISDETGKVHAGIMVYLDHNLLCLSLSSVVSNKQSDLLHTRYKDVNEMDRLALKKRYMDVMMHGEISEKGGAGLGIMTIVLRSQNPSPISFTHLSKKFKIFNSEIQVQLKDSQAEDKSKEAS